MSILNFWNKKKENSSAMIATLPVTNQSTSATEEVETDQATPAAPTEKKTLTVSYATGWPIDVVYGYLHKNNEEKGFNDAMVKSDLTFRDMNMSIIKNKILMVFREVNLNYRCLQSRLTRLNCKSWKRTSGTTRKKHPFHFSPMNVVS